MGGGLFNTTKSVELPPDAGTDIPKLQASLGSNSPIPVLVNDKPITRFDIDQRIKLMRLGGGSASREAATKELIDEQIQLNEAERLSYRVPDEQVDGAYSSVAGGLKLTPAKLDQALRAEGIQPATLKRRLRGQITWRALVDRYLRRQAAQLSHSDIAAELLSDGSSESIILKEYFLKRIVFVVPKGSSESRYTQRRSEANAFRQRFKGCETVLEQARALKEVVVQDIGRRSDDQLSGRDGEAIKKTKEGKTTSPNRIQEGVELIAVCRIREIQSTAAAEAALSSKYALEQADDLGADYLKELREAAIIEYR